MSTQVSTASQTSATRHAGAHCMYLVSVPIPSRPDGQCVLAGGYDAAAGGEGRQADRLLGRFMKKRRGTEWC